MDTEYIPLNNMEIGDRVSIAKVKAGDNIRRRLLDLGFIEGTDIQCVLKGRRGESAAYLIRNTVIALRKEDSAMICVQELK